MLLDRHQFRRIARIEPRRRCGGKIIEVFPQSRYANPKDLPLNRHGKGPFCEFKIPGCPPCGGVYLITVNSEVKYAGECENLKARFNSGYGHIAPRNCFVGGRSTNCRVNNKILQAAQRSDEVHLWFRESSSRNALEKELLSELKPEWNAVGVRQS